MSAAASALLVEALRCWRAARDAGQPAQPRLSALLHRQAGEMLSPVFDSLLALCEAALGRALNAGETHRLSDDERLLVGLVDGSRKRCACIDCSRETASALDCAICSTRIMLTLAIDDPRRPRLA